MKLWGMVFVMLPACAGASFSGGEVSTVDGAAMVDGASEVDVDARSPDDIHADMASSADAAPPTVEASVPEPSADGAGEASVDAAVGVSDGGSGDGWPSDVTSDPYCTDDEIYPKLSHTCQEWIRTTPYPTFTGCCLPDHTCGRVYNAVPAYCGKLGP